MEILGTVLAPLGIELADGAPHLPQHGVVGVGGKTVFVGAGQHLVRHAAGVADAQHAQPARRQLGTDPVDRRIALGAHHHLRFAPQHLAHRLNERGRLPRSRRPVHNQRVAGAQHVAHGLFLRRVEPRQTEGHGLGRAEAERGRGVEKVAQLGHAVAARPDGALQGIEHGAVGIVVETELHAGHLQPLKPRQRFLAGQFHHHAACFGKADRGLKFQIAQLAAAGAREETHLAAIFKIVVRLVVGRTGYLHHKAVERVVVAAPHADGEPAVAALHLAVDAHHLRVAAEGGFLTFVLLLQQPVLLF